MINYKELSETILEKEVLKEIIDHLQSSEYTEEEMYESIRPHIENTGTQSDSDTHAETEIVLQYVLSLIKNDLAT